MPHNRTPEVVGYVCMKAGASLGGFDVTGIGGQDIAVVQVKSNRWPLEVEMLREFRTLSHCRELIHRRRGAQRDSDVREVR
jgi:hypothetical protein